jgi:hypothetical protein
LISATLGGVPLRVATWWTTPKIPSTSANRRIGCWDTKLGKPGAVTIATDGQWEGHKLGLTGGPQLDANHAKIGVSSGTGHSYVILGDMNQQGRLTGTRTACASSQNGRGGLFFVVDDASLHDSVAQLIGAAATASGTERGR